MADSILILSSIIIGLLVGFVLQRGRACTNTAFRNLFLIRNDELFLMIVVVVSVEVLGYTLLSALLLDGFDYNPILFSTVLTPIGGLIFGIGTVLAGGCAGGVCYRVGEGSGASFLGLSGFALGIATVELTFMKSPIDQLRKETVWLYNGNIPSLDLFIPIWLINLIAGLVLVTTCSYYVIKVQKDKIELKHLLPRWNPITTGILLGILGVAARYFSTLSGRPFGLSTTDGIAELLQALFQLRPIGWAGFFIAALIIGSFLSSKLDTEFNLRIPPKREIGRFLGGGLLLGIGADIGYGCNFGHIFGGIPELGISSFVALFFMMIGNGIASRWYYVNMGHDLPSSTPH